MGGQSPPFYCFWLKISRLILGITAQIFDVAPLALDILLISVNLLILIGRLILTALQLVADQRAGAETQCRADRRAGRRMAHCRPDDTAGRSASQRADAGAFFPGGQRSPRAPGNQCSG